MNSLSFPRAVAARRRANAVSAVALLAAIGAMPASALAATYTASSQTELNDAIAAANNDGDASSTITLTGSFSVAGSALTGVTKNLTIDAGAFTLTSTGDTTIAIGAGAELTIDGVLNVSGTEGFSGRLFKTGAGTLNLTGGPSVYAWYAVSGEGALVIKDGANITFDSSTAPSTSLSNGQSSVTVSGDGTVVRDTGGTYFGTASGATLNVENGAHYISDAAFSMTTQPGTKGTVNIRGAGALLQGAITLLAGEGTINVTAGGRIASTGANLGGLAVIDRGGTAKLLVSGENSRWDNSGNLVLIRGSLDVLDRGVVETSVLRLAVVNTVNGAPAESTVADVLVSGEGSELITTSAVANAFQIAGGTHAGARSASLTIADSGKVTVGATGTGTVNMATSAPARAVLNIGGAEGDAATASGTLSAGILVFGPGTSVVNFNHTDAAYGFDVGLVGNATLNQLGSGKTVLTADQLLFTGKTNVLAGILEVNGSLGGTMDVLGGRLQGTGTVGTTRNVAGGTIAPGNSIGTLTINGNYTSEGGALEIEAVLGNDSSAADLLLITGNSVLLGLAPTLVTVINVGGLGDQTVDGIKIVEVQGATSDAGAFVLNGPAIGGAYSYKLFQNDLATGLDGDWYLRSDKLAPTTPTFENYPVALLGMIDLPTLRQRVGDRTEAAESIWTRIEGAAGHYEASDSSTGASYDSSLFLAQIGLERPLLANVDGSLIAGLTAQYSSHTADVTSPFGDGSNATESLGIGATLTWRGTDGTYADLQGQFATFSTDLDAIGYSLVEDNAGSGFAVSLEVGHTVQLDDAWTLTPQAQLSYASVNFDSFTDRFGSEISLDRGDSLVGRLGLAVDYRTDWQDSDGSDASSKLYGIGNLTYEFLDGAAVVVSGTGLNYAGQKFGAELGLGGTVEWADGAQSLHGELLGSSSFEGSYAVKGTLGFSGKF